MKLPDNLKNIRKENNLSQEQLAEKLGVSRQAVSKWESGQSYPEMDKVLLICKLFNYNIDELMNENVKEVDETKQSKKNLNKYIDDFFDFITKTVNMLSSMTTKQKIKCFIEQIICIMFLVFIFSILGSVVLSVFQELTRGIHWTVFSVINNVLSSIYIIIALIIGITIFLHIFKIRYLDYYEYEVIKESKDKIADNEKNEAKIINENNIKEKDVKENNTLENKKEKIIIRDPKHSEAKFLNAILKAVLWFIKFIAIFIGIWFAFLFVGLIVLIILSFLFVKTGLVFWGSLLGLISLIVINFIILQVIYNFIVNRKSRKFRIGIGLIASLALGGISIGIMLIGFTKFNYIENDEILSNEDIYTFEMTDNLSINFWNDNNLEYIENDSDEVKIIVKYSEYYNTKVINKNNTIEIHNYSNDIKTIDMIRTYIEDINNKKIQDYGITKIYVYTSKENIDKLEANKIIKYEQDLENRLEEMYDENSELENTIEDLKEEIEEKDIEIQELKEQLQESI